MIHFGIVTLTGLSRALDLENLNLQALDYDSDGLYKRNFDDEKWLDLKCL